MPETPREKEKLTATAQSAPGAEDAAKEPAGAVSAAGSAKPSDDEPGPRPDGRPAAGSGTGSGETSPPGPSGAAKEPPVAGRAEVAGEGGDEAPPSGRDGGRGRSGPLGLLAFLGVIALGLSVYLLWQRIDIMTAERDTGISAVETVEESVRSSIGALRDELGRIEGEIAAIRSAGPAPDGSAALRSELEPRLSALESALDSLREALAGTRDELDAEIRAAVDRLARPAMEPADVERLLLIANDALALQRDVGTALEALRTADARLRMADDPVYADTRRALAGEIAALEAVPRTDVQGMAFALGGLQRELRSLSPRLEPVTTRGEGAAAGAPSADGEPRTWRTFLGDLWDSLRGLVVIRRSDGQEGPLIAPEQQVFLSQNLYLELEAARLALLERDQANFRQSLETARGWLVDHYDTAAPRVAAVIGRLDELAQAELDPAVPDISGSLAALRDAIERRRAARQQASPPAGPAPAAAPAPADETPDSGVAGDAPAEEAAGSGTEGDGAPADEDGGASP